MKHLPFVIIFVLLATFYAEAQTNTQHQTKKAQQLNHLFSSLYKNGQFTGALLVAENGKVIYKKGFGFANTEDKELFTTATPCYVGSLSKQFTAVGIVQLKEKKWLSYDHSIRTYFADLPPCYQPVTILNLLQHTSGLPLFDDYPDMTQSDVFNILLKQTSLRFNPGSKFEYCNANYTLLGMLIEKIAQKSLNAFLTASVFLPCGMENTYVDEPSIKHKKRAVGYYLFGDKYNYNTYIGGAASVVSTVDDLYKWDRMLYTEGLIAKQSMKEMFTPGANLWENSVYGGQGYGFGWFVSGGEPNRVVQHDGGFAGFRSYIERQVDKHTTIIYISNVRHELKDNIRQSIVNILSDKPYEVPKNSWANWILRRARGNSVQQAILEYKALAKTQDSNRYYFSERECNTLGYYLLRHNRIEDAVALFELNTELFPNSGNVFDSLGEAYTKVNDKQKALESYRKALALDPGNGNAAMLIKQLEEAP